MADTPGFLIIDLVGLTITPEERELLAHPLVGGVILFTRNYHSRDQLQQLCHAIRATRATPLLIMVDQEGGRVQRFINEFTRIPPMGLFGELYDHDSDIACKMAQECGWLMAIELLTLGIDLSLAPVLDLNKGMSNVIGSRAFHGDSNAVISLAKAFTLGMQEAGMAAVGKHFPGHGSVAVDSHLAIPRDERTLEEIKRDDLIPFQHLIQHGLPAVMAAHLIFPAVDNRQVGFSPVWLKEILRKQMDFKGVILSDDLNMEGANISANYSDRVITGYDAGCDFVLLCNQRRGVIQVLDNVPQDKYSIKLEKFQRLQGDTSKLNMAYQTNKRWQTICDKLPHLEKIQSY